MQWSKVEPSLYMPHKRSWSAAFGQTQPATSKESSASKGLVCIKYNRYDGDCKYRRQCKFEHTFSSCGGAHPVKKCGSES